MGINLDIDKLDTIIKSIENDLLLGDYYKEKIKNTFVSIENQLPKYYISGRTQRGFYGGLLWFCIVYNSDEIKNKEINPLWYITMSNISYYCNTNVETIRKTYKEIVSFLNLENLMKMKIKNKLSKAALSHPLNSFPSPSSKEYQTLRNRLLSENLVCSSCGKDAKEVNLIIHHKDGNRTNNNINNLEVTCTACHFYNGHPNPSKSI